MKVEVVFAKDATVPANEKGYVKSELERVLGFLSAEDVKSELRKTEAVHWVWNADPVHAEEACLFDKLFYYYCDAYPSGVGILFDYGGAKEFLCYENSKAGAKRFGIDSNSVRVVAIP